LVIITGKDALAVIDNGGIAAHRFEPGEDNHPVGGGINIQRMSFRSYTYI
jgi:hypothetical protein